MNVINTNALSALLRKKAGWDWTKVMVNHKTQLEAYDMGFKYFQGPYIGIDIDFHHLWGKTVTLVGWLRD